MFVDQALSIRKPKTYITFLTFFLLGITMVHLSLTQWTLCVPADTDVSILIIPLFGLSLCVCRDQRINASHPGVSALRSYPHTLWNFY